MAVMHRVASACAHRHRENAVLNPVGITDDIVRLPAVRTHRVIAHRPGVISRLRRRTVRGVRSLATITATGTIAIIVTSMIGIGIAGEVIAIGLFAIGFITTGFLTACWDITFGERLRRRHDWTSVI